MPVSRRAELFSYLKRRSIPGNLLRGDIGLEESKPDHAKCCMRTKWRLEVSRADSGHGSKKDEEVRSCLSTDSGIRKLPIKGFGIRKLPIKDFGGREEDDSRKSP